MNRETCTINTNRQSALNQFKTYKHIHPSKASTAYAKAVKGIGSQIGVEAWNLCSHEQETEQESYFSAALFCTDYIYQQNSHHINQQRSNYGEL